jgi:Ser-tRNA(Ala) deacylase AlaX
MLTVAGHKLYAPKGVGALYVDPAARTGGFLGDAAPGDAAPGDAAPGDAAPRGVAGLEPLLHGGGQEFGVRAGTENVLLAVGLGEACRLACNVPRALEAFCARTAALRSRLLRGIVDGLEGSGVRVWVSGPPDEAAALDGEGGASGQGRPSDEGRNSAEPLPNRARLPNTLHLCLEGGVSGGAVLARLDGRIMASAQSACHTGRAMSHVLRAMRVPDARARGAMRLSLGSPTTEAEVDAAAALIAEAARAEAGGGGGGGACGVRGPSDVRNGDVRNVEAPPAPLDGPTAAQLAALEPGTTPLYMLDAARCRAVVALRSVAPLPPPSKPPQSKPPEPAPTHVVVVDATVFHPQGGGQPSDVGEMTLRAPPAADAPSASSSPPVFCVTAARKGRDGVVSHHGRFRTADGGPWRPDGQEAVPRAWAAAASRPVDPDAGRMRTAHARDEARTSNFDVVQTVDAARRARNARVHSAGHLLDQAMSLAGQTLVPGKGYHFPDGAYVEYRGKVPAEERAALLEALQRHVDALIARDLRTRSLFCRTAAEARAVCAEGQWDPGVFCGGPDRPAVRYLRAVVVAPASEGAKGCPCGGTHVRSSRDIGAIVVTKIKVKKGQTRVSYRVVDGEPGDAQGCLA